VRFRWLWHNLFVIAVKDFLKTKAKTKFLREDDPNGFARLFPLFFSQFSDKNATKIYWANTDQNAHLIKHTFNTHEHAPNTHQTRIKSNTSNTHQTRIKHASTSTHQRTATQQHTSKTAIRHQHIIIQKRPVKHTLNTHQTHITHTKQHQIHIKRTSNTTLSSRASVKHRVVRRFEPKFSRFCRFSHEN